jgi:outer membrane protein OmpA-like peptidoglycan-associated protein
MPRILVTAAAALLLVGCATERPRYGNNPPPSYASAPPAHLTRQAQTSPAAAPRTVKPLAEGPLASNAVEGYMDNQENELRATLRGSGVIVGRMGDALVLNMRSDALFGANSVALSGEGRAVLSRVALVARKFDSTQLTVNGYTDTTGTLEQNLRVSQMRAGAVAGILSEQGVDPHRIGVQGYGEVGLKIPTGANVSDARNRRIEIRITPRVKA